MLKPASTTLFALVLLGCAEKGSIPATESALQPSLEAESFNPSEELRTRLRVRLCIAMREWMGHGWHLERGMRGQRACQWAKRLAESDATEREAFILASLAVEESGFRGDVADGSCNRRGSGTCDHGAACGYVQMHLEEQWEARITRGEAWEPGGVRCRDVMGQNESAARGYVAAALSWLRMTPTAWGSMGWHQMRAASVHP